MPEHPDRAGDGQERWTIGRSGTGGGIFEDRPSTWVCGPVTPKNGIEVAPVSELVAAEARAVDAEEERDRARWHLAIFIPPIERLVVALRPYLGGTVEQIVPALGRARAAVDARLLKEARADLDEKVRAPLPTQKGSGDG